MGKALTLEEKRKYDRSWKKLIEYCRENDLDVETQPGCFDEIIVEDRSIRINTRYRIDQQVFTLAHEIGHWLIRRDPHLFQKNFPARARKSNKQLLRTKAYKYQTIKEEIEAWKRGKQLLKRLDAYFDEIEYERTEAKCVLTYT